MSEDSLTDLLALLNAGKTIKAESPAFATMLDVSEQAMQVTGQLNAGYHPPEKVRELLSQLFGKAVDESVRLFPPFTADFGKNIKLGKRVFINAGCRFQDQGGITIEDDCLIGHNAVIATLQHGMLPKERSNLLPASVTLGRNVWLGANVTILPGVIIGEDSVIGAGSVVTKNIPAKSIAVGSPARVVKSIDVAEELA